MSTASLPDASQVVHDDWPQNPNSRIVVAIPVRDEVERIGRCLSSLERQRDHAGRPLGPAAFELLLLLNNCSDGTAAEVQRCAPSYGRPLRALAVELPGEQAHAGAARRLALDLAAERLELLDGDPGRALLLSTDGDSRVASNWISANAAAIAAGVEAVAGRFLPDAREFRELPLAVRRRFLRERAQRSAEDRRQALHHPKAHDPWPRHSITSGASLATTLRTYRAVGGLPPLRCSEDVAFFDAVRAHGGRVRHDPKVRVITSCRLNGRAAGGMADTLRSWESDTLPAGGHEGLRTTSSL